MKVAPEMLKGMDIFEFLKLDELKDIAQLCKTEEFEQGEIIFSEGEKAEKIYLILEGRVAIEIEIGPNKKSSVYTLNKGMMFGYPSLIRTRKTTTFARCLDKVKVVTLLADDLVNKIFKKDCRRGYLVMNKLAELIAQKLSETRMQLLSLVHSQIMATGKIKKDMTIAEALKLKPAIAPILMSKGMHCLGCVIAQGETIEQAAEVHGLNADQLVEELNQG